MARMNYTTNAEDEIIRKAEQATTLYDDLIEIIERLDSVLADKDDEIEGLKEARE